VLNELRRVPPGFAAFLVIGAAVVTMILLAAFDDTISGGDSPSATRAAAKRASPGVIDLGKTPYPKKHGTPAAKPPSGSQEQEPPAAAGSNVPLRRLVGQKLIVRIGGTAPSADLLRRVRKGLVGGVILFPDNVGNRSQLAAMTGALQKAAQEGGSQGFVVAVDQEGGPVKRLRAGPPNRAPAQIATVGAGLQEGTATGSYLAGLGVNVDLAPVLDVRSPGSFIASRAFAATPGAVARLGGAFASGLQQAGVAATAKHFPGLGHATVNTDTGPSTVGATKAALDADLAPFAAAIGDGIGLVMMSNASYPAYAPGPAVLSRAIVQGQLRGRLGFGGVIVTDDLEAGAVRNVMSPGSAAVAASQAGVDMLLLARSEGSYGVAYQALLAAAKSGRLDRGALEQSYARIERLQAAYAH
jgi:beta-N-acetylhexosaminidase